MRNSTNITTPLASGIAGAIALTLLHESMRGVTPDAPRLDVLGERAIARTMRAIGRRPSHEEKLHRMALAGDLATNSLLYALVGRGAGAWLRGAFLGTLAGVGAVLLPPILGLGKWPSGASKAKKFLTCGYYITGGLCAAATSRAMSGASRPKRLSVELCNAIEVAVTNLNDDSPRLHDEVVPILDFGSQYSQLIARRVRENGVFSELLRPDISIDELRSKNLKGLILSGGPSSVYEPGAPTCDARIFDLGVPILAICYGMQLGVQLLGGQVKPAKAREFGRAKLQIVRDDLFLHGLPGTTTVWMSHGDQIYELPSDFIPLATTPTCPFAAAKHAKRPFYGVQFHPEVTHTPRGELIFHNFLYEICKCTGTWSMGSFVAESVAQLRQQIGDARVICGLSGGVDSSVTAALLHKAIGDQLICIFVDNGLLRSHERELVDNTFRRHFKLNLRVVDASKQFLDALAGVTDPQEKRKIIGSQFIDAFQREADAIAGARFLAQGTLYPDVIESGHGHAGTSANIKLHHNVGGLPADLDFELVEPLRDLFKDEVRQVGEVLGLPEAIVWRHPFPGPGLAVRVIGEVTPARLKVLREADEILLEELVAANLYRKTAQVFAVLLPIGTVGVMGDARSYDSVIAIRAVESKDFMTADWARLPFELLATISNRIINEVRGVNRVVYDISSKPPATIEWE